MPALNLFIFIYFLFLREFLAGQPDPGSSSGWITEKKNWEKEKVSLMLIHTTL